MIQGVLEIDSFLKLKHFTSIVVTKIMLTCFCCVSITNTQKLDHYYVDKCTSFFYFFLFLLCCFYKPECLLVDISKYEESNVCFFCFFAYRCVSKKKFQFLGNVLIKLRIYYSYLLKCSFGFRRIYYENFTEAEF